MYNSQRLNQIWTMTWIVYAIVPIIIGADKYFFFIVDWNKFISPFAASIITPSTLVWLMGVLEIGSGILMFISPVIASYMIAGLIGLVCINLTLIPGYYDVVLRDVAIAFSYIVFGLMTQLKEDKQKNIQ
jgi:hypothetical protein